MSRASASSPRATSRRRASWPTATRARAATFGTAFVVPGPGLLNAASGLSTAYSASSPVLMIAGQIPKGSIGKNIGLLHEVNDQLDAIAPITKWRQRILEIADIPAAVREAVRQLKTGRPRPVEIELSPETMEDEGEAELLPASEFHRAAAPLAATSTAPPRCCSAAKNPVIYAGGGVHLSGANAALAAVAEYLQAGVIESPEGKGAVSDASDLSLGAAFWRESPLYGYLHAADVVLAVGSRLALVTFKAGQRIIQLDVDPEEIGRNHPNTTGLLGDAKATLEALLERLRAAGPPRASRKAEREALRAQVATIATQEPQTSILKALRAGTPEDAHLRRGHDPGRLLLAAGLARLPPADLSQLVLLRQSRLRVPGGPRRQGRPARPRRRQRLGRRRASSTTRRRCPRR